MVHWQAVMTKSPLLVVSSQSVRPGRRRWACQRVTAPLRESMLSATERMDIHSAHRKVGAHCGAAEICGTTHETVRPAAVTATS